MAGAFSNARGVNHPIWKSRNAVMLVIGVVGIGLAASIAAPLGVIVICVSGVVVMPMGFHWFVENRWHSLRRKQFIEPKRLAKRRAMLIFLQALCLGGVVLASIRYGAPLGAGLACLLLAVELLLAREFTYPNGESDAKAD